MTLMTLTPLTLFWSATKGLSFNAMNLTRRTALTIALVAALLALAAWLAQPVEDHRPLTLPTPTWATATPLPERVWPV